MGIHAIPAVRFTGHLRAVHSSDPSPPPRRLESNQTGAGAGLGTKRLTLRPSSREHSLFLGIAGAILATRLAFAFSVAALLTLDPR